MSNICLILFKPLKMSSFASVLLFMIIIEESLDFLIFAFSSTADEQILTSSCLYEVSLNAKNKKKEIQKTLTSIFSGCFRTSLIFFRATSPSC